MSYICSSCVGDVSLSRQIDKFSNNENPCEYCENEKPTVEISFVSEKCNEVISTFFEVSSLTMAVIHFNRSPAGESLEELIERLTSMPSMAVTDVVDDLMSQWHCNDTGDDLYGDDPYFVPRHDIDSPFLTDWTEMEASLRTEARYLNPKVAKFLGNVFLGLHSRAGLDGRFVLVDAGVDTEITELYRARAFEAEKELEESLQHPEKHLGTPPAGVGKKGGRMNAVGQPAFYGAADAQTAIAEIRPPVGSWVAVAKFRIIRPLKLLDLRLLSTTQLNAGDSLFDPATVDAAQKISFLRELSKVMTMPVMPEKEQQNYLVTQVVADHLAMLSDVTVDGIIYPSVQRSNVGQDAGTNVVLFQKAATALRAYSDNPTALAELRVYLDEEPGSYFDPAIKFLEEKDAPSGGISHGFHPQPALDLVKDAIQVHKVTAVSFATDVNVVKLIDEDPRRRGV